MLSDLEAVHRTLLRTVKGLSERQLSDNRVYPWMEGEPLSYLIAENSHLHERQHAGEIHAWREAAGL